MRTRIGVNASIVDSILRGLRVHDGNPLSRPPRSMVAWRATPDARGYAKSPGLESGASARGFSRAGVDGATSSEDSGSRRAAASN